MQDNDSLHVVELQCEADQLRILEEFLATRELEWASWQNPETTHCVIRVYSETREDGLKALGDVATLVRDAREVLAEPESVRFGLTTLRKEDWESVWKQYFHVFRVSQRLVVKPSWEELVPAPGDVVLEIDPGMSFGTGLHGTTRACLQFMDSLALETAGASLLDAGCGSGILSLAAVKLGFSPVVAFDHDPQAVGVAADNVARAAGDGAAHLFCADLTTVELDARFDVVIANILAPVLICNAERLVGFMRAQEELSFLILSGILTSQYQEVKDRFQPLGLVEREQCTIDEWTSGLFYRE